MRMANSKRGSVWDGMQLVADPQVDHALGVCAAAAPWACPSFAELASLRPDSRTECSASARRPRAREPIARRRPSGGDKRYAEDGSYWCLQALEM